MNKELINISEIELGGKEKIDEALAHEIITNKGKVLMIFRRPDETLYGYIATVFTDLGHGKKQTINELEGFFKHD